MVWLCFCTCHKAYNIDCCTSETVPATRSMRMKSFIVKAGGGSSEAKQTFFFFIELAHGIRAKSTQWEKQWKSWFTFAIRFLRRVSHCWLPLSLFIPKIINLSPSARARAFNESATVAMETDAALTVVANNRRTEQRCKWKLSKVKFIKVLFFIVTLVVRIRAVYHSFICFSICRTSIFARFFFVCLSSSCIWCCYLFGWQLFVVFQKRNKKKRRKERKKEMSEITVWLPFKRNRLNGSNERGRREKTQSHLSSQIHTMQSTFTQCVFCVCCHVDLDVFSYSQCLDTVLCFVWIAPACFFHWAIAIRRTRKIERKMPPHFHFVCEDF